MGGFLSTFAKPKLQLLSGCLPFFCCLELSQCALCFPHHQLDFVNFASQLIIMETCKEFRVEWESVVFFGMNENMGEGGRRGLRGGGGGGRLLCSTRQNTKMCVLLLLLSG